MEKFEYTAKVYPREEFAPPQVPEEPVISCSGEGQCFFSRAPRPSLGLLEGALNEMGVEGWELIQVDYHEKAVLTYWKRRV